MESVSLHTLTFDHPAACRPARITASLHLPAGGERPFPCMVILTSSAGVQRHREHYYALALNRAGTAALISVLSNEKLPSDVRRESARSLGLIGDPSAEAALRSASTSADPYLAEIASEALKKLSRG